MFRTMFVVPQFELGKEDMIWVRTLSCRNGNDKRKKKITSFCLKVCEKQGPSWLLNLIRK